MPEGMNRLNTAMINANRDKSAGQIQVMEGTFGLPRNKHESIISSSLHLQGDGDKTRTNPNSERKSTKMAKYENRSEYPIDPPDYHVMCPDTYEIKLRYCSIRPNKSLKMQMRAETPWKVEIGVFKEYLKETKSSLISNCFEYDWCSMKVLKYKKCSEDQVKCEMAKIYPLLKDVYRNQAGYGPSGNVFSIGQNQINQFMQDTLDCLDKTDGGRLKMSDADRMMVTVNAMKSGPLNPA